MHRLRVQRRYRLIAGCALIALSALVRFVTLYSLDGFLAAANLGQRSSTVFSMTWALNELAHILAEAIFNGMALAGVLLIIWWLWPRLVTRRT